MKKVAVLMSTYNGQKYLEEQIDTILSQEGNIEIDLIIRDDGSTDETKSILNRYQNKKKLIWYSGANIKTAKSFIDLLYYHPGYDYYAFSDQDDFWYADKLIKGIDYINENNKPCLYFCNAECVDENLQSLNKPTYKHEMHTDFYSTILAPCYLGCTTIINNKLAKIVQNNKIPTIVSMHDSFLARVCVSVGGYVYYDDNQYIKYRQHNNNVIGATTGILDALIRRFKMVTKPLPITIDKQVNEIIGIYGYLIDIDKLKWLKLIANYKDGFNRFKLIFFNNARFTSINMKITVMLSILLGNY